MEANIINYFQRGKFFFCSLAVYVCVRNDMDKIFQKVIKTFNNNKIYINKNS